MAEEKKFSHISVTSDDDDDVVIQAGASAVSQAGGCARAAESSCASAHADADAAGAVRGAVASRAVTMGGAGAAGTAAAADAVDAADAADASQVAPASSQSGPNRKDDYHATTLEDIESSKMPTAQKIVIALATLGIFVFAIWSILS